MKLFIALLLLTSPSFAQSDEDDGNMYSTLKTGDGGRQINGYNENTGSTWNTNTSPNGDMNGFDSKGNFWVYHGKSGLYLNSDGQNCVGKGESRTCE